MDKRRRSFVAGSAAAVSAGLLAGRSTPAPAQARSFTPEAFGAKGDGVTNDSLAFAALSEAVNRAGGGTIVLRRTTYIVGRQLPTPTDPLYYFSPAPLLDLRGCTRPLVIQGNGAVLRCAAGLRYGVFDRTGRPAQHPMPYLGPGVASPYRYMIRVENCSGPVEIASLELDGNIARQQIGGPYGDTGRQIPASGIGLINNRGDEIVRDVHTHHHGLDGLIIDGRDDAVRPLPQRLITGLRAEYNARQGCSIVGGRGYAFEKCKFNHTGRTPFASAPGAGVDIEAEGGKKNRDFRFTDCEFVDNVGSGMVADTGDSEGATFTRCLFIGTTSWATWSAKPRIRYYNCRFVGASVRPHGDNDATRATQFHDCVFLDDPKLSPTGKVYMGDKPNYPIVDTADAANILFDRCTIRLTHAGLLPWGWYMIFSNVRMDQRANVQAFPKGRYLGSNVVNGNVDVGGARIEGSLLLNGRPYRG